MYKEQEGAEHITFQFKDKCFTSGRQNFIFIHTDNSKYLQVSHGDVMQNYNDDIKAICTNPHHIQHLSTSCFGVKPQSGALANTSLLLQVCFVGKRHLVRCETCGPTAARKYACHPGDDAGICKYPCFCKRNSP